MPKRKPAKHRPDDDAPRGRPVEARATSNPLLSRGAALITAIAVWLIVVFAYAGPSSMLALLVLLVDGPLLAAWLLSAAGLGALVLRVLNPDLDETGGSLRLVTAAGMGLGLFSLAVLGLGLVGLLNTVTAYVLLVVGLVSGVPSLLARRRRRRAGTVRQGGPYGTPAGWGWLWLVAVPFLALATVAAMVPPGILWGDEPHGYDVVEYHLQIPREWYEAGRVGPLRHNAFSFFPFNVEMHYLLAMHLRAGPWAGMYLAQLMHVAFAALSVAAVHGFAIRLAPESKAAPTLAGVAAATAPWLTLLAPVGYNEGGLLLWGTLAVGWALSGVLAAARRPGDKGPLPAERTDSQVGKERSAKADPTGAREALRPLAIAGLMAGFACGAKLTGVPLVLLAVAAVAGATLLALRARPSVAVAGVTVYFLAGLLAFAPWLARNVAWAGNPVFPEAARLLGPAHFSEGQVERWEKAHSPAADQRSVAARVVAFWRQVIADWRYGFVLIPLSLVLAARRPRDRAGWFLLALLLIFTLFWLGFTHLQSRFFVLAIPLCALLIGRLATNRPVAAAVAALLVGAALFGFFGHTRDPHLHARLSEYLYGRSRMVEVLGTEAVHAGVTRQLLAGIPPDQSVALAGDARAFYYQRPMRLLRYRTVFDVDTANHSDVIAAWVGDHAAGDAPVWVLVDPNELRRFARTYGNIPPLPPVYEDRREPFVLPPDSPGANPLNPLSLLPN